VTQVADKALYISAAALVLSAVIAAAVAIWRTRATLESEARRLDKQLAHDRALREREELRRVIDDAIRTVQNGIYRAVEIKDAIEMERREAGAGATAATARSEYGRARADLAKLLRRLNAFQSRFAVRLGADGALAEKVKECRVRLGVISMLAPEVERSNKRDIEELTGLIDQAAAASEAFDEAARKYARSRLDE
jgi:hypothetical protein